MKLPPWPYYSEKEKEIAYEILTSGRVNYWTGEEGKRFEKDFSNYVGTKYSIAHANGTLALYSAYLAIGLKEGDEVITTPRSFVATASTILLFGAKPIFADVDFDSGCISASTIEPLINKRTKAIAIVHIGGWPADMKPICDLAKDKGLYVVEDCSQAHGAAISNQSVGSYGDISTWSFCQDKIMSTAGEGGMVSTSNRELYEKIFSYKDHGKNFAHINKINTNSSSYKWVHDQVGNNFRLTEIQASIGNYQLSQLPLWNKLRNRNASIIKNELESNDLIRIPELKKNLRHAYYKFYVYLNESQLSENWHRARILKEMNERGVPAFSGSCSELYLEKCFRTNQKDINRLPVARILGETSIMFLVHPNIDEDLMEEYSRNISLILKESKR